MFNKCEVMIEHFKSKKTIKNQVGCIRYYIGVVNIVEVDYSGNGFYRPGHYRSLAFEVLELRRGEVKIDGVYVSIRPGNTRLFINAGY